MQIHNEKIPVHHDYCLRKLPVHHDCFGGDVQAERDRLVREQQLAQEESLSRELERRRLEQTKDEKMRQQIRETRSVCSACVAAKRGQYAALVSQQKEVSMQHLCCSKKGSVCSTCVAAKRGQYAVLVSKHRDQYAVLVSQP